MMGVALAKTKPVKSVAQAAANVKASAALVSTAITLRNAVTMNASGDVSDPNEVADAIALVADCLAAEARSIEDLAVITEVYKHAESLVAHHHGHRRVESALESVAKHSTSAARDIVDGTARTSEWLELVSSFTSRIATGEMSHATAGMAHLRAASMMLRRSREAGADKAAASFFRRGYLESLSSFANVFVFARLKTLETEADALVAKAAGLLTRFIAAEGNPSAKSAAAVSQSDALSRDVATLRKAVEEMAGVVCGRLVEFRQLKAHAAVLCAAAVATPGGLARLMLEEKPRDTQDGSGDGDDEDSSVSAAEVRIECVSERLRLEMELLPLMELATELQAVAHGTDDVAVRLKQESVADAVRVAVTAWLDRLKDPLDLQRVPCAVANAVRRTVWLWDENPAFLSRTQQRAINNERVDELAFWVTNYVAVVAEAKLVSQLGKWNSAVSGGDAASIMNRVAHGYVFLSHLSRR